MARQGEAELSPSQLDPVPEAKSHCGLSQDTFDIRILMAKSVKYTVNFLEAKEGDLHRYRSPYPSSWAWLLLGSRASTDSFSLCPKAGRQAGARGHCTQPHPSSLSLFGFPSNHCPLPSRIEIPFKFHMLHSGLVHGLAFWFDVAFIGSM